MAELFCNHCWQPVSPGGAIVATSCVHLFCAGCSEQLFQSPTPECPVCKSVLTQGDAKKVTALLDGDETVSKLILAGQAPEMALSTALTSVQFFLQQRELYAEARYQQLEAKLEKMTGQCKKKLNEIHVGYKNAKRKYEAVLQQKQAVEADNRELGEKYSQKAKESMRLKEMVPLLQQENDVLRRTCEQLAQRSGVPLGSLPSFSRPRPSPAAMPAGGGPMPGTLGMLQGTGGRPNLTRRSSLGPGLPAPLPHFPQPAPHRRSLPPPAPLPHSSPLHSPAFTMGQGFDYTTPATGAMQRPPAPFTAQLGFHSGQQHAPGMGYSGRSGGGGSAGQPRFDGRHSLG